MVNKVQFKQNGTLISTDTAAPYIATFSTSTPGTYTLTALAYSSPGVYVTSSPVTVTVTAANNPPTVSLTSPTNGTSQTAPASFPLAANASDSDGTISSVKFYAGSTLISTATIAPYTASFTTSTPGTYSLTAVATDNGGATTTSSAVSVTVNAANNPPTVSLTSPTNGANAPAPATFSLAATASDSDGTISSVAFYAGSTLISTATSAPYTASFTTSTPGTYSLTAVATDNAGATTTSSAVSVTVNAPTNMAPTVSLTAPADGASAPAPATFNLAATAADSDGTVASVSFYADGALISSSTSSPYLASYSTSVLGNHLLTAIATDNSGATTTSAAVMVSVTGVVSESRWITTSATYDSYGNMTSETDALGHQTSTVWGTYYGRLPSSTTNAAGQTTTYSPNMACSGQASMTDPNGGLTQWTYDGLCRKQSETRPDNGKTTWAYFLFGNPTSQNIQTTISDSQGDTQSTASSFDGLGREYSRKNNANDVVVTTYDPRGLVASVSAPATGSGGPLTQYTYDARKRLTATHFPDGKSQSSSYYAWSTTTTDEAGKLRTLVHDAYGQVRQVTESVSSTQPCANGSTAYVTTINYDLLGRQVGFTDACGNVSSTSFDSLSRVLSRQDPDMGTWTYKYDDAGRMTAQTDAKGQVIASTYDALNRPLGTTNNKDASSTSFVYDQSAHYPLGRLATATRTSTGGYAVTTKYDYDVMGHVASQTMTIGSRNYTTASTYDGMGHVRTMTYPNNEVLTYVYDNRGLQNSLTSSAFATPLVSNASYDPRQNPVARNLGNGVVESFSYDLNRFWLTGVNAKLGTTQIHNVTLGRDGRGLVMTRANTFDTTDNWTYTYDDVRRLTSAVNTGNSAWTETFSFDPINRVVTSSALGTYNYPATGSPQVHAPATIVSPTNVTTSNTYDTNGNLLTSGSNSFTYDVQNRPTTVNGQSTGYDAAGTRVFQGPIDFVGGDTYDFDTSVGVATRSYYFNGARIASAQGTAQTFYHGDQLNSATTLTDGAGNVISRQVLSPFGRRLAASSTDRIALAGARLDTTGLYTMGAREMHPNLGVFITPDPSGAPDAERPETLNRYAYANNSPTNLVDLTGFAAEVPEAEPARAEPDLDPATRRERNQGRAPALAAADIANARSDLEDTEAEIRKYDSEYVPPQTVGRGGRANDPEDQLQLVRARLSQLASDPICYGTSAYRYELEKENGPVEPYNRATHYGRTPTAADRAAIGAGRGEVADHTPPLVVRYYYGDPETGEMPGYRQTPEQRAASAADRTRMSPQPRSESNAQGGKMAAFAREMKRIFGL
jgi:RHS repeat-associated protein